MAQTLRWGILGTGNIARQFCTGVSASRCGKLACVGSRSADSASTFASAFRIPTAFGSYEQVLSASDIDAVYVSLPNSLHREWTIKALRAGKHVLCEKPFAADANEAHEMLDVANSTGRVLIEAFMYRTHPLTHAWLQQVRRNAVGRVRIIRSSFCFRTTRIGGNIRFDPALAGGALMDIGCYCIDFSRLVAGQDPTEVRAFAHLHETGVDDATVGILRFPGNMVASFTCGMSVQADNAAHICGEEGFIEIPIPWKPPASQAAYRVGRSTPPRMDQANFAAPPPPLQTYQVDANSDLYALESDAFAATVLHGADPFMTPADTLANMRILDEMRRQIGLFPIGK